LIELGASARDLHKKALFLRDRDDKAAGGGRRYQKPLGGEDARAARIGNGLHVRDACPGNQRSSPALPREEAGLANFIVLGQHAGKNKDPQWPRQKAEPYGRRMRSRREKGKKRLSKASEDRRQHDDHYQPAVVSCAEAHLCL